MKQLSPEERLLRAVFGQVDAETRAYDAERRRWQRMYRDTVSHIAWDYGVLDETLGTYRYQKQTKTQCGKRVSVRLINNGHPTCPECRKQVFG